ncbi:MAG: TIGR04086 family membrane protein [Bacillota bacterium]
MHNEMLNLRAVQKGLTAALAIAVILLGTGIVIVIATGGREHYGAAFVNGMVLVSLFGGGVAAGAEANAGGWRHGIFTAVSGALISLTAIMAVLPELFTWLEVLLRLLAVSVAGAAGGIVGVNLPPLSRQRRRRQRYYGA